MIRFRKLVKKPSIPCIKTLLRGIDKGIEAVRELLNRDIEAITSLILLRDNHGVVTALESAIENIIQLKEERGYIYQTLSEAISGFVSDIVSLAVRNSDRRDLTECVHSIPKKRFNLLYALDFDALGWDESQVRDFTWWLDFISSQYPVTVIEDPDAGRSPESDSKDKGQ